jgi:hypothetical protein
VVSVAAGGWYFSNRSPSPPSGEFNIANARYLKAASAIPIAAEGVYRQLDIDRFNATVLPSINTMNLELAVFKRLQKSESGNGQRIASDSARSAALGVNAASAFRVALGRLRVSDAVSARDQLATAINALRRDAQRWKRL